MNTLITRALVQQAIAEGRPARIDLAGIETDLLACQTVEDAILLARALRSAADRLWDLELAALAKADRISEARHATSTH